MEQIEKKMTVKEVAELFDVSERTIQRHLKEMREEGLSDNVVVRGEEAVLDQKEITIIKARIERSGRNDLGNVVKLPNISTDLEMMMLDAKVAEWKTSKILELQEQLGQAKKQLAISAHKVDFYDQVADAKDAIDMRSVAAVLNIPNMGRNNLFDKLRDTGILDQENCPYRRYQDAGYFRVIITKYTDSYGETHVNKKTLVYPRGLDYIRKVVSK